MAAALNDAMVYGWLQVWDVSHADQRSLFAQGNSPKVHWTPVFCLLHEQKRKLFIGSNEKLLYSMAKNQKALSQKRLEPGKEEFDRFWGYSGWSRDQHKVKLKDYDDDCPAPADWSDVGVPEPETPDAIRNTQQYSSFKDCAYEKSSTVSSRSTSRRGSLPGANQNKSSTVTETPQSTPSRLANFFNRHVKTNLKRTKSAGKLDRKVTNSPSSGNISGRSEGESSTWSALKRSMSLGRLSRRWKGGRTRSVDHSQNADQSKGHERGAESVSGPIRMSHSHESLFTSPTTVGNPVVDMTSPHLEVQALHSSVLGQKHSFQVNTTTGSKYFTCTTQEERQTWLQHLRKAAEPGQDRNRRTEHSLRIWIQEAKGVPPKKRYFCEICLDKTIYGKTSAKPKGDLLFWGEHFEFNDLPAVTTITINLYKEADRKKKKDKNVLIGSVDITTSDISGRQVLEQWYPTGVPANSKTSKESSKTEVTSIRIKAVYQEVKILPIDHYQDLIQYLESNYSELVNCLEPLIPVKVKEDLGTSLVRVLERVGRARTFLSDIIIAEVQRIDNETVAFRGNSIATKAMEAYMKLVGDKYLHDTLNEFIRTILDSQEDLEVDPGKLNGSSAALMKHQEALLMYCGMAWYKIINSHCYFPRELKEVFQSLKERCRQLPKYQSQDSQVDFSENLISSCIFLRFLCPAILSPSLFRLTQEFPHEMGARNLTLIAKTVQCLANFTKFGGKESYMLFLNDFVERELPSMKMFTQRITTLEEEDRCGDYSCYVNFGKELALLHGQLEEVLKNQAKSCSVLDPLRPILSAIRINLESPGCPTPPGTPVALQSPTSAVTVVTSSQTTSVSFIDWSSGPPLQHQPMTQSVSSISSTTASYSAFDNPFRNGNGSLPRRREDLVHVQTEPVLGSAVNANQAMFMYDSRLTPANKSVDKRPSVEEINQSWNQIVSAAELVNGRHAELLSYADDDTHSSSAEADHVFSHEQASTVGSSGYQSALMGSTDSRSSQLPLSFTNPMYNSHIIPKPTNRKPAAPPPVPLKSSRVAQYSHGSAFTPVTARPNNLPFNTPRSTPARRPLPPNRAESLVLTNELSKSAEYSHLKRQQAAEYSPPSLPPKPRIGHQASWKHGDGHRGAFEPVIQSSRNDDLDRSSEYDDELAQLRQQLKQTQEMLAATQRRLQDEEIQRQMLKTEWQHQLQLSQEQLLSEQKRKDRKMEEIYGRLVNVEQKLTNEQSSLSSEIQCRQNIISRQEKKIHGLEAANLHLLQKLSPIRDKYRDIATGTEDGGHAIHL